MARTTTRAWLLLLGIVAFGCSSAAPPDTERRSRIFIVNGRFLGHPEARALELRDGKIASFTDPPEGAATLDAGGGWVLPGFRDHHVHLLAAGLEQEGVALSGAETLAAVLSAVSAFAHEHPDAPWIEGSGFAYGVVPRGSYISRRDLDSAVADRPVVLSSYDGHTFCANSKALALAGVTEKTADPPGGTIVREGDGKTPQGALLENAGELVFRAMPPATKERKRAALKRAAEQLSALGITSIDDIEHSEEVLVLLRDLEKKGELPIRVRLGLVGLDGDMEHYQALRAEYASGSVRFGFLKDFVDGVVESKTAYLLDPYAGSDERGQPLIPAARLAELVARAHEARFPVILHAVGDAAVRISLDAFEHAIMKNKGGFLPEHRIEHIEVLSDADAPRFAKLGVRASMQPIHALPEGDDGVWSANLGRERLKRTFPWRTLLDAKATLVFGSDWPVADANPLPGLAVAVTRRDREGKPEGGWNAHQAITMREALRAYTDEDGLRVGAPADIAILSSDVELEKPATLWEGHVTATIVGGRVRFEKR